MRLLTTKSTVRLGVVAGVAACVVGCSLFAVPASQPPGGRPASQVGMIGAGARDLDAELASQGVGFLGIAIAWPKRALPGFSTAAIPTSTNAIHVTVRKGTTSLHQGVYRRPLDGSPTWAKIALNAATNLSVQVDAYREADPVLGVSTVIARGTGSGLNIIPSRTTGSSITLDAVFAPAIGNFSINVGQSGDTITLTGSNFNLVGGAKPVVLFNGVNASASAQVTPINDTTLAVEVPAGAAVGRVVVVNDGIESTSNALFWVPSRIDLTAPWLAWDTVSDDSSRLVLGGRTLQFASNTTWALSPDACFDDYGTPPVVTFKSSNDQGGTIGLNGVFAAAQQAAPTTVTASLGSFKSNSIVVTPVVVQKLELSDAGLTVNAPVPDGFKAAPLPVSATVSAALTLSAGLAIDGVVWTSSDPTVVKVEDSGLEPAALADMTVDMRPLATPTPYPWSTPTPNGNPTSTPYGTPVPSPSSSIEGAGRERVGGVDEVSSTPWPTATPWATGTPWPTGSSTARACYPSPTPTTRGCGWCTPGPATPQPLTRGMARVTALKPGKVTLTAKSIDDGSVLATASVTVTNKGTVGLTIY